MSDISVIGLGNMGAALASTLLRSGKTVTVWNRSAEKAAPLVDAGAALASSLENAITASEATIVCVKTHKTTIELLEPLSAQLKGRTILELSTGDATNATRLVKLLNSAGAQWHIGMILAYPSGIGKQETAILCAGPPEVWDRWREVICALGGASQHIATEATAIPGLFAAMGIARQGFMFGLIYGGAVCRKAGLPIEAFVEQMPLTLDMVRGYADLFTRSVPNHDYDNPGAPVSVYEAGLSDILAIFEATGTPDALPRLIRDLTQRAVDEGYADQELTSLVEMLTNDSSGS